MNLPHMLLLKHLFGVAQIQATKPYCTRLLQSFDPKKIKKSAKSYFHQDKRRESARIVWIGSNYTVMKYFLEMNYLIGSKKAVDEFCSLAIRCGDNTCNVVDLVNGWRDGKELRQSPYGDWITHESDVKYQMRSALRFLDKFPLLDQEIVNERIVKEFSQILDEKNLNENQKITVQKIEGYPHTTVSFCGKYYYPSHKFL